MERREVKNCSKKVWYLPACIKTKLLTVIIQPTESCTKIKLAKWKCYGTSSGRKVCVPSKSIDCFNIQCDRIWRWEATGRLLGLDELVLVEPPWWYPGHYFGMKRSEPSFGYGYSKETAVCEPGRWLSSRLWPCEHPDLRLPAFRIGKCLRLSHILNAILL